MNKKRSSARGRSLPPIIDGEVNGYLTMKVDEIVWRRKPCMNTVVLVKWWGENEPAMFRPVNIKSSSNGIATNTTVSYEIRTNINLFEEYLKDCEALELSVADEALITIVGLVTIFELPTLIQKNPYQHYFPIVNTLGNRIGDLHVGFSLQFIRQPQNSHCLTNLNKSSVKRVQELSRHKAMAYEENVTNGQRRTVKHCLEHYKSPLKCHEILSNHTLTYMCDVYNSQQSGESQVVPDSVISGILEQGQKLRDAIVRSVLEDNRALVNNDIDLLQLDSSTDRILDIQNEGRKVFSDDEKVVEFIFGKAMTRQDEESAIERLKNMSPVTSLLEMAEELGKKNDFIVRDHEAFDKECSKMTKSILEVDDESSVPSSEERNSSKSTERDNIHAANNKVNIETLQAETIHHKDFFMKNIDSLKITVHSFSINKNEWNKYKSYIQPDSHMTLSEARKMDLFHKLPVQGGAIYFVEYELPHPADTVVKRERRVIKERDVSKYSKNNRPWHKSVKRFCSKKQIGSDIYFGQSSLHVLPRSKAPLHRFLQDVNITFRIYSRQLHQRTPLQIGEAQLTMSDILKSEILSSCKDIAVLCTTKIPDCQVLRGVLKVTVELGSGQNCFGNNFFKKMNNEGLDTEAGNDCKDMNFGTHEHYNQAVLKNVSNPRPTPRCLSSNISRRTFKNRKKAVSYVVNKEQEFCKDNQQIIVSEDGVIDSSLSETSVNKPVLLHGLLHVSEGHGFDGLNSYLVCRAFWKEDVTTSDIYCRTGNPHYNFYELIPVLLSADLLERSHNNILVIELWERRLASECDALIGVAKLPLNKFYIAYRDPVIVAQLLLSKYPIIAVDGWVTVSNPVTGLPSGHLHVVLALGTEDQVQLLEISRGLKEATFTHPLQDFQEPMPATHDSSHSFITASVGEITSLEPFSCSVLNHHEPVFSGNCDSRARHINNSLSISAELPQTLNEQTHILGSSLEYPNHNSDNIPTFGAQEYVRNVSADVNRVKGSVPFSTSKSSIVRNQREQNSDTELQGMSFDNVTRHLQSMNQQTIKSNLCDVRTQDPSVSFEHQTIRKEKYSQISSDPMYVNHLDDNIRAKRFSQSIVDQQVKPSQSQVDQSSQFFPEQQTYGLFTDKISTYQPPLHDSNKQENIGISTKHQESQTDLLVLDLTNCEMVMSQNTSKSTESSRCELARGPPLNIIYETCVSNNEVSNVESGNLGDSQTSSLSHNKRMKEGLRINESPVHSTHIPLSQTSTELKADLENSNGSNTSKVFCPIELSESGIIDLNSDSFLRNINQTSELLDQSATSKSLEVHPESNFHVHLEIERAMHLQCFRQDEAVAGAVIEPSTYVSFLLKEGCPSNNESELKMVTPLLSHTANPSWHWHCDTWLSSDLLTNNYKRMIFKVWQSVNGSCKDPVRDIVLGFATVDLTVLLFGMPWISGWFNITDFAGRCSGQIKINITPLENLSHFNQYKISEPKMLNKLQRDKHNSGYFDWQRTLNEKSNCKDAVTSREISDKNFVVSHALSEESTPQSADIITSKISDTHHDVLLRHTSNGLNDSVAKVKDSSDKCNTELQDDMTSSFLSQALKQKLSELDEITQRLKKRLHFVTTEDLSPPFLPWIQETENSFSTQSACHTITNTKESNNSRSEIVTYVNEEANEGNSNLEVTIANCPGQIAVGYSTFSMNINDMERFSSKDAEENNKIQKRGHFSSIKTHSLPQRKEKENGNNTVENTSVNHTSSLAKSSYPCDHGSCSETSLQPLHLRRHLCENWNGSVSKAALNVEIIPEVEDTDDFDKLTDYLMETSARDLELENVFNPLLFHQLLTSCSELKISNFGNVECHHMSPKLGRDAQPNTETVENCSDYEGATVLGNVEVDVTRNPEINTHGRNDKECVNSNSGNVTESRTMVGNFNITDESRNQYDMEGNITSLPSPDMSLITLMEICNLNHLVPHSISLDVTEEEQRAYPCVQLPHTCVNAEQEMKNTTISEQQVSHIIRNRTNVDSTTNSNSEVSFTSHSVSELEFSQGDGLDEMSEETSVFVSRQAPEGGNTKEENKIVNPNSVLECPAETFGIKSTHSTKGQKQVEDINCTKVRTSSVRDEQLSGSFFRPSRLAPSCFKHRLETGTEDTELDLSKKQDNKRRLSSLINEEKIRHIAKIFNTKEANPRI